MRWALRLSVLTVVFAVAAMFLWGPRSADESQAAVKWKMIVPGLARDSPVTPAPTPTPGSAERIVTVQIDLVANEGAIVDGGSVPVTISAVVFGPLPSQSNGPETYSGSILVKPHLPVDAASCGWAREFADDDLRIQVSQPAVGELSVLVGVTFNPSWHYNVTCPGGVKVRYPATGEVSLGGYLALIFPGRAGVTGSVIATPAFSGEPSCLRRYGEMSGSTVFGTGKVRVYVHEPGCLLPLAE